MKRLLPTTLALATLLFVMGGCCITRPNIDYDNGNLKFGPTLSGRTSGFWGEDAKDNLVDYKHIGSIGFGGFVYYEFCEDYPDFGILSGLYFNQYGAKRDYGVDGSDFVIKERLSYFTVPFSATYRVYDNFRVEAGPELSFLLGAKQISKSDGDKNIDTITGDISGVQVGFNLGASYMHPETGLGGFIRYNGGLNKVFSTDDPPKIYNGGMCLGIRYTINSLFEK